MARQVTSWMEPSRLLSLVLLLFSLVIRFGITSMIIIAVNTISIICTISSIIVIMILILFLKPHDSRATLELSYTVSNSHARPLDVPRNSYSTGPLV